ncbi:MAG: zinc ribbon domain-containing protein [Planctomycetota bacterium]|nr:zinc ribbon domain-containing protein [Planctomycetota bacterium]
MPTYEYECKKCGSTFDIFQSIKASPLGKAACEKCGTVRPVRRLIGTGGGVIFKGSGFYQTDYRSESYKKAAKAEKESSGSSDAKSGDAKSGDAKSGDSKSGDTKAKPTDGKAASAAPKKSGSNGGSSSD